MAGCLGVFHLYAAGMQPHATLAFYNPAQCLRASLQDRTISRLTEMQSLEYLLQHARAHEPVNVLALQEAVQKHH
jgi:hypothetical protein